MDIYLGSSSPRRKQLLGIFMDDFTTLSPDIDETPMKGESARNFCIRMGKEKGESLFSHINSTDFILITGDTLVSYEDHILGKPDDFEDAVKMLQLLSGKEHQVISSISLQGRYRGEIFQSTEIEETNIFFKSLSKHIIEEYLNLIDYMDKAGSYAIQDNGELIVEKTEGSLSNVVGFPLRRFFSMVNHLNLEKMLL